MREIWAPCWLKQESAGPNSFLRLRGSVKKTWMVEMMKSLKTGHLSFLLGVQFFLYKSEISASGGGDCSGKCFLFQEAL